MLNENKTVELHGNKGFTLPENIGFLGDGITILDLANCSLAGPIPVSICQCTNLRRLELGRNKLSGKIPRGLCKLKSLLRLDLSHNKLVGTVPKQIGSMLHLQRLFLNNNCLSGDVPKSFDQLIQPQLIDLSNNCLDGRFLPLRLLSVRRLVIGISGNKLQRVNIKPGKKVSRPVAGETRVASFPGAEGLTWKCMEAQKAVCGHCCVFTEGYTGIKFDPEMAANEPGCAPPEAHAFTCKKLHCHFEAGGPLSEAAHWMYGCRWFDRWIQNIEAAKQAGASRFAVYKDSRDELGNCQKAEVDYLEAHDLEIEWRQVQFAKESQADRTVLY
jgi:hypothetical protein